MPDLDWTLSVPLRRSWAEVCRWITSLAGGSLCRGNVGWLDVAPSIQLSLRLKRHLKWCAAAILSVSARRSVELDDDKVVSEYEEDWLEGGIGSAIRVSCPSYLGPSWQFSDFFLKREGTEREKKRKQRNVGWWGYLLTYFWGWYFFEWGWDIFRGGGLRNILGGVGGWEIFRRDWEIFVVGWEIFRGLRNFRGGGGVGWVIFGEGGGGWVG